MEPDHWVASTCHQYGISMLVLQMSILWRNCWWCLKVYAAFSG